MSSDIAIRVQDLSKCYQIYDTPRDRLKQFLLPRVNRAIAPLKQIVGRHTSTATDYYKEFWALRNVSFEVKRGETVGIIGRNGSGKSTLLQMICSTLTPTGGRVDTFGKVAALLELGSGFNPEFTGRENVYLNGAVLGLSKEEIDARYLDIAAFADIGDFIEQPVKTYSSGMMVRLAFAVIAHVDADILVIDEALAVGDAFFTQKCMRFLRNFMKNGTVLFVSHDTASVRNLCNRTIWLEKGVVLLEGTPKEVCESYLEAYYEAHQGKGTTTRMKLPAAAKPVPQTRDPRQELLNSSTLRNDIDVFSFRLDEASAFGRGGAQIQDVVLCNPDGERINHVVGGEPVSLIVRILARQDLLQPIVGFSFKDRLGQVLFGDNTYLSYYDDPLSIGKGTSFVARFSFIMPILPVGDYSVGAAIATGTQVDHIQHHWIHDALLLKSLSSSVSTGLVGIPMHDIRISIDEQDSPAA